MATIYRIYCTTENSWVSAISSEIPTTCFNDVSHTVNPNSVQILSKIPDVLPYSLTSTLDETGAFMILSVELSSTIPEGSYSLISTTDSGGTILLGVALTT